MSIARKFIDQFQKAETNRATTRVGGKSVNDWLYETYWAYNGDISDDDEERWKDAINEVLNLNLTKHKISTLCDNIKDMFLNSAESPFVIEPTPIAQLSKTDVEKGIEKYFKRLGDNQELFNTNPELIDKYIQKEKVLKRVEAEDIARKKALNMTRLMKDQLEDGGFRKEFNEFLNNFCLYPYAVFYAPYFETVYEPSWNGNKYVRKEKTVMMFKNISPFDYYWSKDTTAGGNGSFDFIKERLDISWLKKARNNQKDGWRKEEVMKALVKCEMYGEEWLGILRNPTDGTKVGIDKESMTGAVESLRCFGKYSGEVLANQYDVKGLTKDEYYEVEAIVVHEELVYLKVNKHINQRRPIFTCSYRVNDKSVAGHTVFMMIQSLEKIVNMLQRMLLKNSQQVANPLVSMDINALELSDEEKDMLLQGKAMITKPIPVNQSILNSSNIITVDSYQNNIGTLQELLRFYTSMIDIYSGIPAMMHGTPQGSGANRTSSGIAMLYQQAIKQIQNAMMNLDMYFLEPFIKVLYDYNMQFHDDIDVKGDCKVKVRGSSGLILKEARKAESLEIIQVLSQFQNSPNLSQATGQIIEKYVQEYLSGANVDVEQAELGGLLQEFKMLEQQYNQEVQQTMQKNSENAV